MKKRLPFIASVLALIVLTIATCMRLSQLTIDNYFAEWDNESYHMQHNWKRSGTWLTLHADATATKPELRWQHVYINKDGEKAYASTWFWGTDR